MSILVTSGAGYIGSHTVVELLKESYDNGYEERSFKKVEQTVIKIGEVIFEDIYKDKKFKYSREYNFPFNQVIDDTPRGSKINDIGIRIITPYYDLVSGSSENELKMLSSREYRDVIINISNDSRYIEELEYVLQIDSYLRLKSGTKVTQSIEDIKTKKSREIQVNAWLNSMEW